MTLTVIVTRPAAQCDAFSAAITQGVGDVCKVLNAPLIKIVFLPITRDLSSVTDLIFTSANGVAAAARLGLPKVQKAWCVGPKTSQLAQDAGFETVQGPGDAAGLMAHILTAKPRGHIVHIRGQHARGNICAELDAKGLHCVDVIAYDQQALSLTDAAQTALKGKMPVVFPLFSPRTATILSKQRLFTAPLHCVMMSDAVRDAGQSLKAQTVTIAARPDEDAMKEATISLIKELTQRRD